MNKRKWILAAGLVMTLGLCAQQPMPEDVPAMVVEQKSEEWYRRQETGWREVARREPHNERAWKNLFAASRYGWQKNGAEADERLQGILEEMERAIPGSYVYHFCRYRAKMQAEDMEKAYRMMPDSAGMDYDTFLAYFWMTGQKERIREVAKRYYSQRVMPSALLRYNYNELQCMPKGALYFGNGDAVLLPKLLLQYGMEEHQDKMIVCLSFLWMPEYYEQVCRDLGIPVRKFSESDYKDRSEWQQHYLKDVVSYIIQAAGRPSYISPVSMLAGLEDLSGNLYSEGLVLRYSEQPYDNYAPMRKNVEQRLRLDYLLEPAFLPEPEWQSVKALQVNYLVLLAPLVEKYREWGDVGRSEWLSALLKELVDRWGDEIASREEYRQYIRKYLR
jgi:hypothetical protein